MDNLINALNHWAEGADWLSWAALGIHFFTPTLVAVFLCRRKAGYILGLNLLVGWNPIGWWAVNILTVIVSLFQPRRADA